MQNIEYILNKLEDVIKEEWIDYLAGTIWLWEHIYDIIIDWSKLKVQKHIENSNTVKELLLNKK